MSKEKKSKYSKLRDKYEAMMFILESVIEKLAHVPYIMEYDSSDHILDWQKQFRTDMKELRMLIDKEWEKEMKKNASEDEVVAYKDSLVASVLERAAKKRKDDSNNK